MKTKTVTHFQALVGKGITGTMGKRSYFLGKPSVAKDQQVILTAKEKVAIAQLEEDGKTVMVLTTRKSLVVLLP